MQVAPMPVSVRFDDKILTALKARAKKAGVSVSEIVREAVKSQLEIEPPQQPKTPFESWKAIFTGYDSGESDRSQRVKELVGKAISAKHAQRAQPK
jgi:hypothetical protein